MSALTSDRARTRRRQLGFAGLVLGCLAVVEAKAATAPPSHRINLGGPGPGTTGPAGGGSPGGGAGPATGAAAGSSTAGSTRASGARNATGVRAVTGQAYDIGYGIVQVRVVFSGKRIADVVPVQLPTGGRSGEIASYAAPVLRKEVLAAQSPNIDTVSGASYTSEGYARSVQSALDQAR